MPQTPPPGARPARATALAGAAALLVGCGSTAAVEAAPHAADPECAEVMLSLPDSIGDFDLRETTSQATAAFGEPSAVVVRCGVEPPGPSPEHCVTAEGVDWLAIEREDDWQLVSYGRDPAVEVLLDVDRVASSTAMVALAGPAENVEQTRECTVDG
ncbi:MAG: DUF3515 domain-containing protein [Nesterenkonia sp.]|uniref:DUF3515 domain-containing protein n=1 Tax=Nesterenkonia marinintestina TaxID=2979865 RepID=UPI0021C24624|nr:DUF3515 domain-containing protein [Nesterenkonia sp. GX14115]MDO5492341.1 DUF3515 domain-containing protein [Nesterenkonia sp.]